jgi:hypothetical protein
VWVGANRTISFSAPGSYTDFSTANAGGSFLITDSSLATTIQAIISANDYLYIFGISSINIISGLQVVSGSTVFSNTNITADIGVIPSDPANGSPQIFCITSYYRSVAFATPFGFYILSGTTPQKISDPLDGIAPLVFPFTNIPISAGTAVINNNTVCLAFMFQYDDPVKGLRTLIAIYYNKKWLFTSQGDNLYLMATAFIGGVPTLYATDGTVLYELLAIGGNPVVQTIQSKLFDMGNPTQDKQVLKVGVETTIASFSAALAGEVVTEIADNYDTFNPVLFPAIGASSGLGYYFYKQDQEVTGKYIGINITGTAAGQIYSAFHLQYELRASWDTIANSAVLPSPVITAVAGNAQSTIAWAPISGATSYNLYWSTTPNAGTNGTLISGVTSPYVQTGLTNGTTYYYVVTAVSVAGASLPSNQASDTPYFSCAYVADEQGRIYQYGRNAVTGELSALTPAYVATGSTAGFGEQSITIHPSQTYVSAVDNNGVIYQFSRSTQNGLLTSIGTTTFATNGAIFGINVHPSGNFGYIQDVLIVWQFSISNGVWTSLSPAYISADSDAYGTMTPDGLNIYILHDNNETISHLAIDQTNGQLSIGGVQTVSHHIGYLTSINSYVYAMSQEDSGLYNFSRNAETGVLTALGTPFTADSIDPISSNVSADGTSIYDGSNTPASQATISQFHIVNGVPAAGSPATVSLGSSTGEVSSIAQTSDGLFVYATLRNSSGLVYQFSRTGGLLTVLGTPSISAGENPGQIVVI